MTIDELVILLNNRLNSFKLTRDYARMNGDLEAMNAADTEIAGIQATLYKLYPLMEHPVTPVVVDTTVTELDPSVGSEILAFYDITSYATDPLHEDKVAAILNAMGEMKTAADMEAYIRRKYPESPVTGQMIMNAAVTEEVDARLTMAIMEQDSRFGTVGLAVSTTNPGNVGNDDGGNIRHYGTWQEGVTAVAEWLGRHRIEPEEPQGLLDFIFNTSTTTPSVSPTATTTPPISTTTPEVTPAPTATTTPPVSTTTPPAFPTAATTPPISTTTPEVTPTPTATTTPSTPELSTPLTPAPEPTATSTPTSSIIEDVVSNVAPEPSSTMSTTTPTQ